MKKLLLFAAVFGLALASAQAAIVINVSVDENANGLADNGSPGTMHAIPGGLVTDPSPNNGLGGNVLVYLLPFAAVNGDLIMQEPGGASITNSDIIRFVTNVGNVNTTWLIFYSDNLDGVDALADTGLPGGSPFTNIVTMTEVGPEGANGLVYTPTAGQPGYISSTDFSSAFNIVSDATSTPEPASFALIGAGLIGLALAPRLKKK